MTSLEQRLIAIERGLVFGVGQIDELRMRARQVRQWLQEVEAFGDFEPPPSPPPSGGCSTTTKVFITVSPPTGSTSLAQTYFSVPVQLTGPGGYSQNACATWDGSHYTATFDITANGAGLYTATVLDTTRYGAASGSATVVCGTNSTIALGTLTAAAGYTVSQAGFPYPSTLHFVDPFGTVSLAYSSLTQTWFASSVSRTVTNASISGCALYPRTASVLFSYAFNGAVVNVQTPQCSFSGSVVMDGDNLGSLTVWWTGTVPSNCANLLPINYTWSFTGSGNPILPHPYDPFRPCTLTLKT